jgi:hypothetical protein
MKKKYFFLLLFFPLLIFSQGSGNTLSFDGNDQIVTVPSLSANIGNSDFTIECFAKFSSFADYGGLITAFDSNNGGWAIHQELDGSVTFLVGINASGAGSDIIGSLALATDEWYHIVAVKNGTSLELFVNGESQGTVASNRVINYYQVFIGSRYLNNPFPGQLWRHNGELDEIRIWNSALTQSEIRDWMTKKVTSSHPKYANLVAYYNFDSGTGTTLVDQTSNGNNGTLVNTPTWQTSSAPIGDDSSYLTSVDNTSSLNLVNSDGSDLTVNVTSGTAESLYIYNVNEAPNVTNPPIGLDQLSQTNYWGVKAFGSASLVYEVVYNYQGHMGISDENNLRLSSRDNNASLSWIEQSASLNTSANTLVLGGQTGTEFILASVGGNTLPVEGFELLKSSIYPNPTKNVLKLRGVNVDRQNFEIFDVNGRKVYEGLLNNSKEIEVHSLNSGLYFLNLGNKQYFKFFKD